MTKSKQERRLEMAVRTVTGEAREGFFIPYRYAAGVPEPVAPYAALLPFFGEARPRFEAALADIAGFADELIAIDGSGDQRTRWDQYWYPRMDAAAAYALVRKLRPQRIIEIGSGHSTRFMTRALSDGGFSCEMLAIDPKPRADITTLPLKSERKTLQEVDLAVFAALTPGDFLCVDSSHILMPGTDVDIVLNRILPNLPSGVLVTFHDIFLPYPYPPDWDWRNYNEQNGVGALLQGGYELVFASQYAVRKMAEFWASSVVAQLPLLKGAKEGALWLRKK